MKGGGTLIDEYIDKYGRRLYGLCITLCADRFDADDLYQDTWLKAYRKFNLYNTEKPFEAWVTGICVNTYRDYLRKKKIRDLFDIFDTNDEKDKFLNDIPDKVKADYTELHWAINKLPEKLRVTIILFYFYDMKEKQVAESLGIPVGTVKSRLNQAKKSLRKELSDETDL